jgi:thiamine biosynthesis protein ThiS
MQMHIVVNGEPRSIPEGQSVLDLLNSMQIDPARVAIELDRRILKQPLWAETALHPGATLEIVQFVGGG